MWLMAAVNLDKKDQGKLKQPYLSHTEPQKQRTKRMNEKETLSYIFEGVE